MADKVIGKRAVAHIVVHVEMNGSITYNVMNFATVEEFDALDKAMHRVQGLVPNVRLVWEYSEDNSLWSGFALQYKLKSGRIVRVIRNRRSEPAEGF